MIEIKIAEQDCCDFIWRARFGDLNRLMAQLHFLLSALVFLKKQSRDNMQVFSGIIRQTSSEHLKTGM